MHSCEILFCLGLLSLVAAKVQFLGVAIAGGDFGCDIDGSCPTSKTQLPLGVGTEQMKHFAQDNGLNMFRLPVSWQFLVNNKLGGPLDGNNFAKYDQLMQSCLSTGAHCMIDIHNFARWNGGIIGQGGPTDDEFASLWTQLAEKYAANDKVVFGLMNEPHHLNVDTWAKTCQIVVTAIREAGARSQMVLLPGTNFDSAATLVESGSAAALMDVKNPDGSVDGLLLDVHKYLDVDNSGTHSDCVTDNRDAFAIVAQFLRDAGRLGLVSETGAASTDSCFTNFCAQNQFINENSDVFLGLVGWAAGSFSTSYVMSLTPSKQGGTLVNNELMDKCVIGPWENSGEVLPPVTPKPGSSVTSGTPGASASSPTSPGAAPSGTGSGDSGAGSASPLSPSQSHPGGAVSVLYRSILASIFALAVFT